MTLNFSDYSKHDRGPRRFLPMPERSAHMIKGTLAVSVRWRPIRWLGRNSGFYREEGKMWRFVFKGRP